MPFRQAQIALTRFTRGAVTIEDTTIARHTVAIGAQVDGPWMYRPREQMRRVVAEHAMDDCTAFHGDGGRKDIFGFGFSANSAGALGVDTILSLITEKELAEDVHMTDGWPTFSDWPSFFSSTHQTQYYTWMERAWRGGLRLIVQHATTNEIICDLTVGLGIQSVRYDCKDMLNVDRQIMEIYRMERYIDAQNGGPGKGWFRVVQSPAEAREVISQGKLAGILGIEASNVFSCYLTPGEDDPECNAEYIKEELDRYYEMGVRGIFPDHKFSNAFSPTDGSRGIFELGDFLTTGHFSNFVEDCPEVPSVFDNGQVEFAGLNQPREDYLSPPPNPPIEISDDPINDFLPIAGFVLGGGTGGNWCQKTGLTEAGENLVNGMMERGMIVELDHLSRRSYLDVFGMLEDAEYPGAAGTHGNTNRGELFAIGGVSKSGIGRCADSESPGAMFNDIVRKTDQIAAAGGYPAIGFGFDLNGFAGIPGPRFGPFARCGTQDEETRIEYPFTSKVGYLSISGC